MMKLMDGKKIRDNCKYYIWIALVAFAAFLYGTDEVFSIKAAIVTVFFAFYCFVSVSITPACSKEDISYIWMMMSIVLISTVWDGEYINSNNDIYVLSILVLFFAINLLKIQSISKSILQGLAMLIIMYTQLIRSEGLTLNMDGLGTRLIACIFILIWFIIMQKHIRDARIKCLVYFVLVLSLPHVFMASHTTLGILAVFVFMAINIIEQLMVYGCQIKRTQLFLLWISAMELTMLCGESVNYYCGGISRLLRLR